MLQNRVVIVAGPTASGKSALASDIAKECGGVVVNADSMQVYKGISILAACPGPEDKKEVEHRLYEIYDPATRGNVVDWLQPAVAEIRKIWQENKIPIVTGGTGLYLDHLINGTTPIPETAADVRQKVADILCREGLKSVYAKLQQVDPETADRLSANDKTRICRAYEVWLDTGIKLSQWHKQPLIKYLPDAAFLIIKICPSAAELDKRCYLRFEQMLAHGALEEAQNLAALNLDPSLPAMKALGVAELVAYVNGKCTLEQAVAAAKLHTRQYAKRQRTWFKNKLKADIELDFCYNGDAAVLRQITDKLKERE